MVDSNDSVSKTLSVVVSLSLVCSVIVSMAAVGLRTRQENNVALDQQAKILEVAGVDTSEGTTSQLYSKYIEPRVISFSTGEFISQTPNGDSITESNQKLAASNEENFTILTPDEDKAGIRTRANQGLVYLVHSGDRVNGVILPIHGKGLWSMMYAFVAVETDGNTVSDIIYYDQGETPGLGGEVENPSWRSQFKGKKLYDDSHRPAITIVKSGAFGSEHDIDALFGATITSNGIQHQFDFWLGDMGFGPFLERVRSRGLE